MKKKLCFAPLIVFFIFSLTLISCQAEKKETIQFKNKTAPIPKVDIADIEEGIKAFITNKAAENDGFFLVKDDNKFLRLQLVRVHTEYLSNLGPNSHFACVDLADTSGDVYDVDFFMEGKPGEMEVTETTVHKLNGKPFYTWKQKPDKTWHRLPVAEASNLLLGVIEGEDQFQFNYEVILPTIVGKAKMWIPVAITDDFQEVELAKQEIPGKHEIIKDIANNNAILFLDLTSEESGKPVTLVYNVKRKEKGPYEDASEMDPRYLESSALMPVGRRFRELALEAIGEKKNDSHLMQARAIYDYIIDNMKYMKYGDYGKGDSIYACDTKTGNCTEFHSLFISMARSVGIPARFSIGAAIPSDRDEGGIDGYHCWAEFYAEGKWWPVDISEGNKYTALSTYYFGRNPANRVELSRGRDLALNPGPEAGPVNFMAYPVLEIDGKSAVAKTTFSFTR
ncbi:transglutaminase-like domain-containing protein [Cyclobacterium amurskyense]|uniref:Transglutaminase n=1 Tax=Cyclobacterium amurskyense TaxID=320787 RepID=A0A0H4PME5_9BACT|nr:transglutaminase domain-containing protein [Cyclobacterium amurskyense]AKP54230.1 transglutaminase [Cyclobacterium amurskyense]